ncbi:MAG: hypothetical protein RMK49_10330, partial [Abditibacteriales bacterium]|nr:hypothetical protein [Abditibacteriales bacterium]
MPPNNSSFGRRPLTLQFSGGNVHTANIEVFYPATGYRHPPGGPEGWQFIGNTAVWTVPTPNWFYYYWQAHGQHSAIRYINSDTSIYYDGDSYVHVGRTAYLPFTMRLFQLQGGLIAYVDTLSLRGIHTFVYMAEHELAHKRHYEIRIYPQTPDPDGDRLGSAWEIANNLDPALKDTTGAYPGDPDGDLDCIADIEAYGRLLTREDLWREDWADTGLQ